MPVIKGDNTVLWGADGLYGSGQIVDSGEIRLTGEKLEIQNSVAETVTVIYFDDKHQGQFEMIVKTAAPELARGDAITLAGRTACLVDDVAEVYAKRDVMRLRVTCTKYAGIAS